MKKIISVLAIFTLAIGLSFAYADELVMSYSKNLVNSWVDIDYKIGNDGGYDVWISRNSVFHYDTIFDAPEQIHFQITDRDGGITNTTTIYVREGIEEEFFPEPEPEPEEPEVTPEIQARLDAKEAEQERVAEKALTCILGIEGSSIFTEYRERLVLEKMIYFKSLPLANQERQIILWTEECRVWSESYISKSPEYKNKFLDEQRTDIKPKQLDESDSLATDPLTEEDFAEEIKNAEDFMCSEEGKQRGLCVKEFEGVNRGGYTEGAECGPKPGSPNESMCPLQDYNQLISSAISAQDNYSEIEKLVCEKYLNQYAALVERIQADDETAKLPNWLAHCEVS